MDWWPEYTLGKHTQLTSHTHINMGHVPTHTIQYTHTINLTHNIHTHYSAHTHSHTHTHTHTHTQVHRCLLPAEAPESTVGVQTDGDLPGGVELTLQLDGPTQGTGGSVGHLEGTATHHG